MPFLLLPDDVYIAEIYITGRTANYESSLLSITGRTDNYSSSIDITGRTGNYVATIPITGQLAKYSASLMITGKTSNTVKYFATIPITGRTAINGAYSASIPITGTTMALPGSGANGDDSSIPGAGTPADADHHNSPGFGAESLVYYMHNQTGAMTSAKLIKFSASYESDEPATATVTFEGTMASATGDFYVSCSAFGINGEKYSATFGPFKNMANIDSQKKDGVWTTTLSLKDSILQDKEPIMPLLPELVPWEVYSSFSPDRQAAYQRYLDQQLRDFKKAGLKCLALQKALYDDREMYVDQLVMKALTYLPVPYIVVSKLPYPGAKIYAETLITHGEYPNPSGTLIGTSLSTNGKKPLEFMAEVWGGIGFVTKTIRKVVYIGYKEDIDKAEAELEGGAIGIGSLSESNLLENYNRSIVNTDLILEEEAQEGKGSFNLPSKITVRGAKYRKWLAPLPPEPGDGSGYGTSYAEDKKLDEFENDPNGVLTTDKEIYGTLVGSLELSSNYLLAYGKYSTYQDIIAHEHEVTTKSGGLLRSQEKTRSGYVSIFINSNVEGVDTGLFWRNQYVEKTQYFYENSDFPETVTRVFTARAKVDQEGQAIFGVVLPVQDIRESEEVKKTFHYSGYLMKQVTTKVELEKFFSSTKEDVEKYVESTPMPEPGDISGDISYLYRIPRYRNNVTTETWTPLGKGRWLHEIKAEHSRIVTTVKLADDITYDVDQIFGVTLEDFNDTQYTTREETDQSPEYAKAIETGPIYGGSWYEVICEDVPDLIKNGYPYDEQLEISQYTAGRGDPVIIDAPWATSLDLMKDYAKQYVADRNLLSRVKTSGTFFVPIMASRLGRNSSMNVEIDGNGCTIEVSVG